ncbi:MAG: DUF3822 family protein [Raineya sp.]|jgi:hypothetical protein|nr:DUF3822 family protein [Raineya sp.]
MDELNKKIRITHRINDSSLDINNLSQYGLFLSIEDKNLRAIVVDEAQKKCMLLEDYRFSGVGNRSETIAQLTSIYENHLVLKAGYWKEVVLVARTGGYATVPDEFFESSKIASYLSFHPNQIENTSIKNFHYSQSKTQSVFYVENEYLEWVQKAYPSKEVKVMHQADTFLAGALSEISSESEIYICIENRYMNMVIVKEGNLLLNNRYYYHSPQDFVYYVLFAIDELKLDIETCIVKLYGEISKDSGIFNLLYKYIRQVDFGKKPKSLSFSYVFDEVLEHRYFDLYNAYLCASNA